MKIIEHVFQLLLITQPDRWSAASMYQATRLFASNMDAKMAQRFYNMILLPRIRDDIDEYKKLNFHLYMVTKKKTQHNFDFHCELLGIKKSFVQAKCILQRHYPSIVRSKSIR